MNDGKQYRIDIDGYAAWENEHGFGLVGFDYDDTVVVESIDDEWAYGVDNGRIWASAIPAQFLIEVWM